MTFDPSKPVQTRDGRPARILCTDVKNDQFPICAAFWRNGVELADLFARDGKFYSDHECNSDLINIPEKRVGYVNVYPHRIDSSFHLNRKSADLFASENVSRVACIRVEYEEGRFDD